LLCTAFPLASISRQLLKIMEAMNESPLVRSLGIAVALALLVAQTVAGQQPSGDNSFISQQDQDGDARLSRREFQGNSDEFRTLDIDDDEWITSDDFALVRDRRRQGWLRVLVAPAVVLLSIFVSAVTIWLQLRFNSFLEFTKRYAEVHSKLPPELWKNGRPVSLSPEQEAALWEYFFLYWIEWKAGRRLLKRSMWKAWRDDLAQFLKNPTVKAFWEGVKHRYDDGFRSFVDQLVGPHSGKRT
jgi:hypothetical protein